MDTSIKLAILLPDVFYLHGDRGNVLAIDKICRENNISLTVDKITYQTEDFNPLNYDIILCNPGEIVSFPVAGEFLNPFKENFINFILKDRPLLVTGTSIGLWGIEIKRQTEELIRGLGIIPIKVYEKETIYGDDIYFTCMYNMQSMEIIGNQIQMIDIKICKGDAWGHIKYGYGNSGMSTSEGFITHNAIFTNTLGPLLVCNPWLTKEIVKIALQNKGYPLEKIINSDFELEKKSLEIKKKFIGNKKSYLKNTNN